MLAEFGTVIPEEVEIHVSDSTAMDRYLVLPKRPDGTDKYSEEQLAALVTRDTMIGMVPTSSEPGGTGQRARTEHLLERLPNDIGGLGAEPVRCVDHELEPWQKRCHALADVLDFHKIVNTEEKRRRVEALGAEVVGARGSSACPVATRCRRTSCAATPFAARSGPRNTSVGEKKAGSLRCPNARWSLAGCALVSDRAGSATMLLARAVIYLRPLAEACCIDMTPAMQAAAPNRHGR